MNILYLSNLPLAKNADTKCRAVSCLLLTQSGSIPLLRQNWTTSSCAVCAAQCSTVLPCWPGEEREHPEDNRAVTRGRWPLRAARWIPWSPLTMEDFIKRGKKEKYTITTSNPSPPCWLSCKIPSWLSPHPLTDRQHGEQSGPRSQECPPGLLQTEDPELPLCLKYRLLCNVSM